MSADPRMTLAHLARVDRRGAVWCAALVAEQALHLVRLRDVRPSDALHVARRWAYGHDVPRDEWHAVSVAAHAAGQGRRSAGSEAALAAYYAIVGANVTAASASDAAHSAVQYTVSALCGGGWVNERAARHLVALVALVAHQLAPVTPTLADVLRARPRAAVAWDAADVAALGPVRLGTLGEALDRARRGGWRWSCPVERAIAERLPCEHPVLARLGRAA